jgi:hypothetical protein
MFVPRWGLLLFTAVILLIIVITTTVVLFNDNTKPSKLYNLHNCCTELTNPSKSRDGAELNLVNVFEICNFVFLQAI